MSLTRRRLLSRTLPGAVALAACPAAACSDLVAGRGTGPAVSFGDPVTVLFWHTQTGAHRALLDEFVTKFNATNGKNITVRSEYQGRYDQLHPRTIAAIRAGSPPDLVVGFGTMIVKYAEAGVLVNLDDYLARGPSPLSKDSLNDIFPQYLESNRYASFGRRLLSFPFANSLAVLYYNESLLERAGQTKFSGMAFDEFRRQVVAVSRKDGAGRPQVYGHYINTDATYAGAFILANGGELLSPDRRRVRFNEPPGVEILDMWSSLARDGFAYTSVGFNYQTDFIQGRVAGVHDTTASRPFLRPERSPFRWGIGMIPQRDPKKPVTVTFGAGVALFKSRPLTQAAGWEWIKFLAGRDQTVAWAIKTHYMPLRRSAADHPDMKAHWQGDLQGEQAFRLTPYARPEPNVAAWPEIRELLQQALTSVVQQKAAPKAALDEAATQANRLLDEKR